MSPSLEVKGNTCRCCCCCSQSLHKRLPKIAAAPSTSTPSPPPQPAPARTVVATVLSRTLSSRAVSSTLLFITLLIAIPLQIQASALGVHFERSPESAVAPKGDEVVFECEMNLKPDRLEWKFRHSSNRSTDGSKFKYLTQEVTCPHPSLPLFLTL